MIIKLSVSDDWIVSSQLVHQDNRIQEHQEVTFFLVSKNRIQLALSNKVLPLRGILSDVAYLGALYRELPSPAYVQALLKLLHAWICLLHCGSEFQTILIHKIVLRISFLKMNVCSSDFALLNHSDKKDTIFSQC